MNFMYPPIYQCPNGHPLCSECKRKINSSCPICRNDIGNIRALTLENVADTIEFPCKYKDMGRSGSFTYDSKQMHEEECHHRPYPCQFADSCSFVAQNVEKLVAHLSDDHQYHVDRSNHLDLCFTSKIFIDQRKNYTVVIHKCLFENCMSKYFCLNFMACDPQWMLMEVYVTFLGEDSEAWRYLCRLEVSDENGLGKRTWAGPPLGTREVWKRGLNILPGLILKNTTSLARFSLKIECECSLYDEAAPVARAWTDDLLIIGQNPTHPHLSSNSNLLRILRVDPKVVLRALDLNPKS